MDKQEFLNRLHTLRAQRQWSKSKINEEAGLPTGTIYQWYNNSTKVPTVKSIEAVCKACHITLSQFFVEESQAESEFREGEIGDLARQLSANEKDFVVKMMIGLIELRTTADGSK